MKLSKKFTQIITMSLIITSVGSINAFNTSKASEINTNARCMDFKEQEEYVVTTGTSNLNLRAAANKNSKVIAKIPSGSIITKISDFTNNWAKTVYVTPQGKEYIGYSFYGSGYAKKANFENFEFGSITANRVIFRDAGNKNSKKLGYLSSGDQVQVVNKANSNGYYKVVVTKATDKNIKINFGYVHKDYFKKEM